MMCPVCGGPTHQCFAHRGYWIRGCEMCRHRAAEIVSVSNHVQTVYDDNYFSGGGAGYSDYLAEKRILIAHGRHYGQLMARYCETRKVLDIGAAAGFVLKGYVESGWHGKGIEPNRRMAEYARTRLDLDMVIGTLEDYQTDESFDLVSMIQVIAHFVDPRSALRVANSLTRPGGFWLIETWNRKSFTARLFGKHWHEYSPPSVLHWFSPEGLSRLALEFGFHEVARGRPSKWISTAHAQSLLRYRLESSRAGRTFSNMVNLLPESISLPYPAEDLLWMIFQRG